MLYLTETFIVQNITLPQMEMTDLSGN